MPVATYDLFGQPPGWAALTADTTAYTLGVQFSVALTAGQTAIASGIRFFSASGAGELPQKITVFAVSGHGIVESETAAWSGAAGSGWVTALFAVPPALASGASYKAAVTDTTVVPPNWYSAIGAYWSTGPGAAGITNGPLSAPNNAGGDGGQGTFNQGLLVTYPLTSFNATNYGVDVVVRVTSPAAAVPAGGGGTSMLRRSLLWADL